MATIGYTDAETLAMPLYRIGIRLGTVEGSDGYPKGSRSIRTRADSDENPKANRFGRFDPRRVIPRRSDPGVMLRGDAAR